MQNLLRFDFFKSLFKYFGYRKKPEIIQKIYYQNALYHGETKRDSRDKLRRHGLGILITNRCETFYGEFKNDMFHGEGIAIFSSGVMLRGTYRKNLLHGVAAICLPQDEVYISNFRKGRLHGAASYFSPKTNCVVSLYFKDGRFEREIKHFVFSPLRAQSVKQKIMEGIFRFSRNNDMLFDEKDFKDHLKRLESEMHLRLQEIEKGSGGGGEGEGEGAETTDAKEGSREEGEQSIELGSPVTNDQSPPNPKESLPIAKFVGSFLIEQCDFSFNGVFDSNQTLNGMGIFISFRNKIRIGNFIDDKMNGFGIALINNLLYVANFRDNSLNDEVWVKNMASGEYKICRFSNNNIQEVLRDGNGAFAHDFFYYADEADFRAKISESNIQDQECFFQGSMVNISILANKNLENNYQTNNVFSEQRVQASQVGLGAMGISGISGVSFGAKIQNVLDEDPTKSNFSKNLWSARRSSKLVMSNLNHPTEPDTQDPSRTIDMSIQPSIHSLILSKRTNFGEKPHHPNPSVYLNNSFEIYGTRKSDEKKDLNEIINKSIYNRSKTHSLINQNRYRNPENYVRKPSLTGSGRVSPLNTFTIPVSNGLISPQNFSPHNSNENNMFSPTRDFIVKNNDDLLEPNEANTKRERSKDNIFLEDSQTEGPNIKTKKSPHKSRQSANQGTPRTQENESANEDLYVLSMKDAKFMESDIKPGPSMTNSEQNKIDQMIHKHDQINSFNLSRNSTNMLVKDKKYQSPGLSEISIHHEMIDQDSSALLKESLWKWMKQEGEQMDPQKKMNILRLLQIKHNETINEGTKTDFTKKQAVEGDVAKTRTGDSRKANTGQILDLLDDPAHQNPAGNHSEHSNIRPETQSEATNSRNTPSHQYLDSEGIHINASEQNETSTAGKDTSTPRQKIKLKDLRNAGKLGLAGNKLLGDESLGDLSYEKESIAKGYDQVRNRVLRDLDKDSPKDKSQDPEKPQNRQNLAADADQAKTRSSNVQVPMPSATQPRNSRITENHSNPGSGIGENQQKTTENNSDIILSNNETEEPSTPDQVRPTNPPGKRNFGSHDVDHNFGMQGPNGKLIRTQSNPNTQKDKKKYLSHRDNRNNHSSRRKRSRSQSQNDAKKKQNLPNSKLKSYFHKKNLAEKDEGNGGLRSGLGNTNRKSKNRRHDSRQNVDDHSDISDLSLGQLSHHRKDNSKKESAGMKHRMQIEEFRSRKQKYELSHKKMVKTLKRKVSQNKQGKRRVSGVSQGNAFRNKSRSRSKKTKGKNRKKSKKGEPRETLATDSKMRETGSEVESRIKKLSPPKNQKKLTPKKPRKQEMNYYIQEEIKKKKRDKLAKKKRKEKKLKIEENRKFAQSETQGKAPQGEDNRSRSLIEEIYRRKDYRKKTRSKIDTGRFNNRSKYDQKLIQHYSKQGSQKGSHHDSLGSNNPAKETYNLRDLLKQKRHLKQEHGDLHRVYDGLKHSDNFLQNGLKERNGPGAKNDPHKNQCWDFEKEYSKAGKHIRDNYYRDFDS